VDPPRSFGVSRHDESNPRFAELLAAFERLGIMPRRAATTPERTAT